MSFPKSRRRVHAVTMFACAVAAGCAGQSVEPKAVRFPSVTSRSDGEVGVSEWELLTDFVDGGTDSIIVTSTGESSIRIELTRDADRVTISGPGCQFVATREELIAVDVRDDRLCREAMGELLEDARAELEADRGDRNRAVPEMCGAVDRSRSDVRGTFGVLTKCIGIASVVSAPVVGAAIELPPLAAGLELAVWGSSCWYAFETRTRAASYCGDPSVLSARLVDPESRPPRASRPVRIELTSNRDVPVFGLPFESGHPFVIMEVRHASSVTDEWRRVRTISATRPPTPTSPVLVDYVPERAGVYELTFLHPWMEPVQIVFEAAPR